jgi:hypothetical protein
MAHVPLKVVVSAHNHPTSPKAVDFRSRPVHIQKELLPILTGADSSHAQQAKTEIRPTQGSPFI